MEGKKMPSKMRHGLLISLVVISLIVVSFYTSYAETINYIYDELNRLKWVEYEDGTVIEYIYDNTGNRTELRIQLPDITPPTGSIIIDSGAAFTNSTTVTLTLSCNDASGCSQMQFSNDNVTYSTPEAYGTTKSWTLTSGDGEKIVYAKFKDTPGYWSIPYNDTIVLDTTPPTGTITINGGAATTNSPNVILTLTCSDANGCSEMQFSNDDITYSTPEAYSTTKAWTLTPGDGTKTVYAKFKDTPDNWSIAYNDSILLDTTGPVRIGGASYSTIQAAYNAALNGDTIKCRDLTLVESLIVNRNIAVTLEGGYDSSFTTNYGTMTILRGMITTTAGGGTITIKNFILEQ